MSESSEFADITALSDRVLGPVLLPSTPGFAEEVSGVNLAVLHRPDVAVGVTSTADVVEAVRFAAEHSLEVRMHATGHGAHHAIERGMLIVTRRLDGVTVDAENRIATIGAGADWAAVHAAAAPHGLTPIPGSSSSVGAVGYTLGGGLGPLARSHGFTSDFVRGFELVSASGDVVTADAENNPDLFWALRGGKGGLGVVTSMRLELVPLAQIYAGALFFETAHIASALHAWREWSETAHPEVTTSVAIINFPPFDQVPEPLRGRRLLTLRFAYPGDAEEGARLAAPLRSLAGCFMDTIGVLPTSQMRLIHNDPDEPGPGWSAGTLLSGLDSRGVDTLLAAVDSDDAPIIGIEVRHLGSATARDVSEGSAVGGRSASHTLTVIGLPDPALFEAVLPSFYQGLMTSIDPWLSAETNINFGSGTGAPGAFSRAWSSSTHERLQAVRALYDPAALFTFGPPAG